MKKTIIFLALAFLAIISNVSAQNEEIFKINNTKNTEIQVTTELNANNQEVVEQVSLESENLKDLSSEKSSKFSFIEIIILIIIGALVVMFLWAIWNTE